MDSFLTKPSTWFDAGALKGLDSSSEEDDDHAFLLSSDGSTLRRRRTRHDPEAPPHQSAAKSSMHGLQFSAMSRCSPDPFSLTARSTWITDSTLSLRDILRLTDTDHHNKSGSQSSLMRLDSIDSAPSVRASVTFSALERLRKRVIKVQRCNDLSNAVKKCYDMNLPDDVAALIGDFEISFDQWLKPMLNSALVNQWHNYEAFSSVFHAYTWIESILFVLWCWNVIMDAAVYSEARVKWTEMNLNWKKMSPSDLSSPYEDSVRNIGIVLLCMASVRLIAVHLLIQRSLPYLHLLRLYKTGLDFEENIHHLSVGVSASEQRSNPPIMKSNCTNSPIELVLFMIPLLSVSVRDMDLFCRVWESSSLSEITTNDDALLSSNMNDDDINDDDIKTEDFEHKSDADNSTIDVSSHPSSTNMNTNHMISEVDEKAALLSEDHCMNVVITGSDDSSSSQSSRMTPDESDETLMVLEHTDQPRQPTRDLISQFSSSSPPLSSVENGSVLLMDDEDGHPSIVEMKKSSKSRKKNRKRLNHNHHRRRKKKQSESMSAYNLRLASIRDATKSGYETADEMVANSPLLSDFSGVYLIWCCFPNGLIEILTVLCFGFYKYDLIWYCFTVGLMTLWWLCLMMSIRTRLNNLVYPVFCFMIGEHTMSTMVFLSQLRYSYVFFRDVTIDESNDRVHPGQMETMSSLWHALLIMLVCTAFVLTVVSHLAWLVWPSHVQMGSVFFILFWDGLMICNLLFYLNLPILAFVSFVGIAVINFCLAFHFIVEALPVFYAFPNDELSVINPRRSSFKEWVIDRFMLLFLPNFSKINKSTTVTYPSFQPGELPVTFKL